MSTSTLQETKVVTQRFDAPDGARLDGYRRTGGYEALRKALSMTPDEIIDVIKTSGLRGRGGAAATPTKGSRARSKTAS